MNFLSYKFEKESEPELLQFLKAGRQQKTLNKNCDLSKHQVWQKILSLDESKADDIPIIDLSSDEELTVREAEEEKLVENDESEITEVNDVAFAIKENLETQNDLSQATNEDLVNCNKIEELFDLLHQILRGEEIFYLWVSLDSISKNELLVTMFCRHLLLPRIRKEYCDDVLTTVNQLSIKYPSILNEEFLSQLLQLNQEETEVCLQYVNNFNSDYQCALLRCFIFSIEKLNENYLKVVESLLNNQVEYETLNKLVEMLSNIAEDYCKDKKFGKLLINTIEFLGSNVILLEQPLKHIIAGHKSVWKSKLEKTFDTCFEDSLMLSQSFRD